MNYKISVPLHKWMENETGVFDSWIYDKKKSQINDWCCTKL